VIVYLAGPIEQCSEDEVHLWRNYVSDHIPIDIAVLEPRYDLGSAGEIFHNTKENVEQCDMVFAYLPKGVNDRRPSYGTIFEISYGHALNKEIAIISDDEFVHNHPVMKGVGNHFKCLDNAIRYLF